jgi:hypothetical protein
MSKIKIAAICFAVLTLIGADVYTWHCYQEERNANEVLIRENQKLRGHVEMLAANSIELMHKLEAANDRAEAMLSK